MTPADLKALLGTTSHVNAGDRVTVRHPGLPAATGLVVGAYYYAGDQVNVRLDGTGTVVEIPQRLLERTPA